jgi:hypothetical protein
MRSDEKSPARAGLSKPPGRDLVLRVFRFVNLVLDAADGVLHLACEIIDLAFGLELRIARNLAESFLDFALGLIGRAFDPILVHDVHLSLLRIRHGKRFGAENVPPLCRSPNKPTQKIAMSGGTDFKFSR